jgi:hypothetical protein
MLEDPDNLRHLVNWDEEMCDTTHIKSADVDTHAGDTINERSGRYRSLVETPWTAWRRESYLRRTAPWEWVSYRRDDGGNGLSVITPLGLSLPIGWVVAKTSWVREPNPGSPKPYLNRFSIDALYGPSASRSLGWYFSVGADKAGAPWSGALEAGLRLRGALGDIPTIGPAIHNHALLRLLLGGRIGIRTNLNNGPGFHNTRLVIEGGGGSF